MKRLLLDTHVLLWWLGDDPRLGAGCRALMADPRNTVYVSAATVWEVGIKRALDKLDAPEGLADVVNEEGFEALLIGLAHGEYAAALPPLHRDPFDRMLVAQAQLEGLQLVSADTQLAAYGVSLLSPAT